MSSTNPNTQADHPAEPPRLTIETVETLLHVRFPRRKIDGVAVRELYEAAAQVSHGRDPRMLVNLEGVSLVSSGVMGILVTIQKLFRHVGGQLHIVSSDPMVVQQFEVANLHLLLKVFSDLDSAMAMFKN